MENKLKTIQQMRLRLEKDLREFVEKTNNWSKYNNGEEFYEDFLRETLIGLSMKKEIIRTKPKPFPDGWQCKSYYQSSSD